MKKFAMLLLFFTIGLVSLVHAVEPEQFSWARVIRAGGNAQKKDVLSDSNITIYFTYASKEHLSVVYRSDGLNVISVSMLDVFTISFKMPATLEAKGQIIEFDIIEIRIRIGLPGDIYVSGASIYDHIFSDTFKMGEKIIISFDESRIIPTISAQTPELINDVKNILSIDEILAQTDVSAKDYDGTNLTDKLIIVNNEYAQNVNILGKHCVELMVKNALGYVGYYELVVNNVDVTAPVITGPEQTIISYKDTLELSSMILEFSIYDEHDVNIEIKVESYNVQNHVVGEYELILSATDAAGNSSTFVHKIFIIDDVAPVFEEHLQLPLAFSIVAIITPKDLLLGLTAFDEIDQDITDKIVIKHSAVKSGVVGEYEVIYQVKDKSGNIAEYIRYVKILANDSEIIYITLDKLQVGSDIVLNENSLANLIAEYEHINYITFSILANTYTGNERKPGEYEFSVQYVNAIGDRIVCSRTIEVIKSGEGPTEPGDGEDGDNVIIVDGEKYFKITQVIFIMITATFGIYVTIHLYIKVRK